MRVVFAGTPEFARVALAQLHSAGFHIPLVLTQPDRPAGRGLALQASPVKRWAQEQGMEVVQPRSLRLDGKFPDDAQQAREALEQAGADVMVVAAYGLILPQWVLALPRLGCLNIHASLLPRWRGAAPIHRAIEAGDRETGITIMQMDAGLDTGDMLLTGRLPIGADDTTGSLHDKLAALGGQLVVEALGLVQRGELHPLGQPAESVTYAQKIAKSEAQVDWSQPAEVIGRRIRAFDPSPGAVTTIAGENVKLWRYEISSYSRPESLGYGTILHINEAGISVSCGQGALCLTELQRAGGKRLSAADFLRGFPLTNGMQFGAAA
jgi:methionyl-tRNA formyltransferase